MKKNLLLASLMTCSTFLMAQTAEDALLFSDNNMMGTARSAAMGNAFGALGADISCLSVNPAGLAVYRSYDFSMGVNLGVREMSTYFKGSKTIDDAGNFNLSSIGFVAPYKRDKGDWRRTNVGFSYQKSNIFKSNKTVVGYDDDASLIDVFLAYANGQDASELNPFYEGLAFETYLIDPVLDSLGEWVSGKYTSVLNQGGGVQYKNTTFSGSMGEFAMSYAGSYKERLYLGATLAFASIDYTKNSRYNESGFADTATTLEQFDLYENLYTSGGGINLKLGAILRATEQLRLGIAWHSPTVYSMQDQWESAIESSHSLMDSAYFYTYQSPYGIYNYELITPMKVVSSAALVISKQLVLSGDIEYVDYSTVRLGASQPDVFNEENESLATHDPVYNTRLGAELNLLPIVLRAGYAAFGVGNENSTVSLAVVDSEFSEQYTRERESFSFGVGKRGEYQYIDFAYTFTEESIPEWMHAAAHVNKTVNTYHNVMVTMGWKF